MENIAVIVNSVEEIKKVDEIFVKEGKENHYYLYDCSDFPRLIDSEGKWGRDIDWHKNNGFEVMSFNDFISKYSLPNIYIVNCSTEEETTFCATTIKGYGPQFAESWGNYNYVYVNIPTYTIGNILFDTICKTAEEYPIIPFSTWKELYFKKHTMKEKEIIAYKIRSEFANFYKNLVKSDLSEKSIKEESYSFRVGSQFHNTCKNAKVLDLWFDPIYEEEIKKVKFGEVVFAIKKGDDFATTEYGKVTKQEIEDAIKYIENPPKLNGYNLTVHCENEYRALSNIDEDDELKIGFGCQSGTLKELKEILYSF